MTSVTKQNNVPGQEALAANYTLHVPELAVGL